MMNKLVKIPLMIAGGGAGLFAVTFTIYMFNLDMKMMALLEPLLAWWYDNKVEHKYFV